MRAALARPRLAVSSFLTLNSDVDGSLTALLEGDTSDSTVVRSGVAALMASVWSLLDAEVKEHSKSHNRAFSPLGG